MNTVQRELQVAFSLRAQPRWFRLIKECDHSRNGSVPTTPVVSVRGWRCSGCRPITSLFLPLENTRLDACMGRMG